MTKEKEMSQKELKASEQQRPDNSKRLVWLALILLVAATTVGNILREVSYVVRHDVTIGLDHEVEREIDAALAEVERELEAAFEEIDLAMEEVERELETAERGLSDAESKIEQRIPEQVLQEVIEEIQREINAER